MFATIELPLWVVVVAGLLAAASLLDRLLIPSARWMLRRRVNRAIDDLNTRLKLRIQPFKIAKRGALIDQLIFDPEVLRAIEEHARANGVPRAVAQDKARRYAREIVPSFSTTAYFSVGTRLARRVSQYLYRVRLGFVDEAALAKVDPHAAVVFVINHRSNMDYILVTYMAATTSALSYAVGEWARVWLLQSLIRAMGAYFVRRDSGETLYRRVLARYVAMATAAGVTQAVFPEGGLTRDGALRPAKLGLVSYMVSGFDPSGPHDIVFIPVGLNYDRVLEDRIQIGSMAQGQDKGQDKSQDKGQDKPSYRFNLGVFLGFLAKSAWRTLRGRWFRYGYACVSFGAPLSYRQHLSARGIDPRTLSPEQRHAEIEALGHVLMARLGEVIPALPVPLVASALLDVEGGQLSAFEIKGRVSQIIAGLETRGCHVHIPRADLEYAVDVGLRMLLLRRLAIEVDGLYRANPAETTLLRYYANSIAHLRVVPLSPPGFPLPVPPAAAALQPAPRP